MHGLFDLLKRAMFLPFFLFPPSGVLSAQESCGPVVQEIPDGVFEIASGTLDPGTLTSLSLFSSRRALVVIESGTSALVYVRVTLPNQFIHTLCGTGISVRHGDVVGISLDRISFGRERRVYISSGSHPVRYRLLSDISPGWNLTEESLVRQNLYVYVFENAPLAAEARRHVEAALGVWRKVGIDFRPIYKNISGGRIVELLGNDQALEGFLGDADLHEGEWRDRERVQGLKPDPQALAIFFARGTQGLIGSTRYDPHRNQIYIDREPLFPKPPVGRTVAHEIGHALLGAGHTGNPGAPHTSGLMRVGSSSMSISAEDAERARTRATNLPR